MKKIDTKDITYNAIIAVLYFILTMITYPISFLGIQFRVAEILILLCFFKRNYVIGLTIGCALANIPSAIGPIDIAFGIVTTLISGLLVSFSPFLFIACLCPILVNSFAIGAELFWFLKEPFWLSVGLVCLGETVVMCFGYALTMILSRKTKLLESIKAERKKDFKF